MERHVDAGKRNGRVSTLKLDVALLLLLLEGLLHTASDDLAQHFANLLDAELLCELGEACQ